MYLLEVFMKDYSKVFKAYDIRALYGSEIDENFSYYLGKGVANYLIKTYWEKVSVILGGDTRWANDTLIESFSEGLLSEDVNNITVAAFNPSTPHPTGKINRRWVCSTSMLYSLGKNFDFGVAFSASHNPKEYVWMKVFERNKNTSAIDLVSTELLKTLFDEQVRSVSDSGWSAQTHAMWVVPETHLDENIQKEVSNLFNWLWGLYAWLSKQYSFVVDFSNGAAVTLEKDFLMQIVSKTQNVSLMNDYADGDFPAHHSDTNDVHAYEQLTHSIKAKNSDFGIMFDGDADRIWFVDNKGNMVNGDIISAIIAKQILNEHWDWTVLYDVMSSKVISEVVAAQWWTADVTRVWRYFISKELQQRKALFGWELSGHYLFADVGGFEMPLLALYYVMKEFQGYESFETMISAYTKYPKSPVMNYVVQDSDLVLQKFKDFFVTEDVREIDWVNVFGKDFVLTARKSNTEPKVRVVFEANTQERYDDLMSRVEGLLK